MRVAVYCTCVAGHAAGRAAEQCVLHGVVQVVLQGGAVCVLLVLQFVLLCVLRVLECVLQCVLQDVL